MIEGAGLPTGTVIGGPTGTVTGVVAGMVIGDSTGTVAGDVAGMVIGGATGPVMGGATGTETGAAFGAPVRATISIDGATLEALLVACVGAAKKVGSDETEGAVVGTADEVVAFTLTGAAVL